MVQKPQTTIIRVIELPTETLHNLYQTHIFTSMLLWPCQTIIKLKRLDMKILTTTSMKALSNAGV